jgi:hypothetical protein
VALILGEALLRSYVSFRAGSIRPLFHRTVASTVIERADAVRNHALIEGAEFIATGTPPGFEFCTYGRISAQGLNEEPVPVEKTPGEFRILVLGDSFVEARQVLRKDNVCKVLERRLAERSGRAVRVINAGISSYSPLLGYLFFQHELVKFKPDLVIFAFFANDVFDDIRYTHNAKFAEDGRPLAVTPGAPWPVFKRGENSQGTADRQAAMRRPLGAASAWWAAHFYVAAIVEAATAAWERNEAAKSEPRNDEFFILENNAELAPLQQHGWRLSQKYLGYLKHACDTSHSRLLLTSVPIASQITGQNSYDHFFFSGRPNDANHTNLQKIAGALSVPYVDLFSPLRSAPGGLYYPHDGHWTPKAHAMVAQLLEQPVWAMMTQP